LCNGRTIGGATAGIPATRTSCASSRHRGDLCVVCADLNAVGVFAFL